MAIRNPEQRTEELVAKFRERGYRITPQRLALLRLLATSEGHPSALQLHEQLLEQFPTTSLATVYLPQPDSPTSANVSPFLISKSMPLTAFKVGS